MPVILLVLGIALYSLREGKAFARAVKLKLHKVVFDMSATQLRLFRQLVFNVQIRIDNPTAFAATLNGLYCEVVYKGKVIASTSSQDQLKLAANGSTMITVPVAVNTAELIPSITDIIPSLPGQVFITVRGVAKSDVGDLKFSYPVNVGLR